MVNSASQALAEFKSQKMGGLLAGTSSSVNPAANIGTSLMDSASDRLARSAPKSSSSAFMDGIRQSGSRFHQTALAGLQAKQAAAQAVAAQKTLGAPGGPARGNGQYSLPNKSQNVPKGASGQMGEKGYGGRYGLDLGASDQFTRLEAAYRKQFGQGFIVNDGYRSYAGQVEAKRKYGSKAATPGTSVHGWGRAVDLGGAIYNEGSAQHAWMRQNAAQFKWYWVGQRYGEPWHWEYHPEW